MHLFVLSVLFSYHISSTVCQRYYERNPLPVGTVPFADHYDDDYTESYDFLDDNSIHRWNVDEFPHPRENPHYCNRMKASYVCDPDHVLKKEEADKLDSFVLQLYKETLCICEECKKDDGGIVVGIALLKNMFQPYNQHPSKTIRSFSETLRNKWKLGKCDNDILIVVATTDRLSFTDVGKSTASYVSLEEAHRIFLENKSHFSAGHFYDGLRAMLADYHKKTRDMKLPVKKELDMALIAGSLVGAIVLLGIILFVGFMIYRRCKRSKDPEEPGDKIDSKSEGVSSSWTKKDIKVLFTSMKSSENPQSSSTKYQPCETDEKDLHLSHFGIEDEVIDTTLAVPVNLDDTQLTTTTADISTTELLDKELTVAVEEIGQTFKPKREYNGHETDL